MTTETTTARYFFTVREFGNVYEGHFFDRGTMSFFRSRVCNEGRMIGGRYFVTSEKACFDDYRRVYTVRAVRMLDSGTWTVDTVGELGAYRSVRSAVAAARRMEPVK